MIVWHRTKDKLPERDGDALVNVSDAYKEDKVYLVVAAKWLRGVGKDKLIGMGVTHWSLINDPDVYDALMEAQSSHE